MMETREEKLATWTEKLGQGQCARTLTGLIPFKTQGRASSQFLSEGRLEFHEVDRFILNEDRSEVPIDLWHFKAISFPRARAGRLVLSVSKDIFRKIQDSWNLHPRTIEVFLANNGVFTSFSCPSSGRTSILLKVSNSRSTGFDCMSATFDSSNRTTYVLYHHLHQEDRVFASILSTPERCISPYFPAAVLYSAHHQQIEFQRNTLDTAVQNIERQTSYGNPGRIGGNGRRNSSDEYPDSFDPKAIIQQLSYCQTDVAILKNTARCSLSIGEWLIQAIDMPVMAASRYETQTLNGTEIRVREEDLVEQTRVTRLTLLEEVEYTRRRMVTLVSQVQQICERAQSQTTFVSEELRLVRYTKANIGDRC